MWHTKNKYDTNNYVGLRHKIRTRPDIFLGTEREKKNTPPWSCGGRSAPHGSHTLMNLYLPCPTCINIFDGQDHTTPCSPPPRAKFQSLCGNALWVVMLLSPVLHQQALCILPVCLNGLHAFLTDREESVCMCVSVRASMFSCLWILWPPAWCANWI